jgi:hypothetical protein
MEAARVVGAVVVLCAAEHTRHPKEIY